MQIIKRIIKYGYVIYLILIILLTIINMIFNIIFYPKYLIIILYLLYCLIALIGVYSMYKNERNKMYSVINIIFIIASMPILIYGNIILFLPILTLIPLVYIKEKYIIFKILGSMISFLSITIFAVVFVVRIVFSNFSSSEVVEVVYSPKGTYKAVETYIDQGGLGGDIVLKVERDFNNIVSISKRLLVSDENIEFQWIDNENILINEKVYRVKWF